MPTTLLTGAAGFAGHHCLEHLLAATDWDIVATDSFRHKGKSDRIAEVIEHNPGWRARLRMVTHDLTAPFTPQTVRRIGPVDYVIAMAAQSHVDRSIEDPVPFVANNVQVALSTLEYCREARPKAVIVVSTDEVYGPEPVTADGLPAPHREWSPILPSNPYSASKACQEAIAISYWRTYGVPVVIVNCMNLIGERQDPEKYLPMLIARIRDGLPVPVHGVPGHIGSRHYLHARNLADGIVFILRELRPAVFPAHIPAMERNGQVQGLPPWPEAERPDRYNIAGPDRVGNLELAQAVAGIIGRKLDYKLVDFHSARPGHDPHYGLDPAKLTRLGWVPPVPFGQSLQRTVNWSLAHDAWLI